VGVDNGPVASAAGPGELPGPAAAPFTRAIAFAAVAAYFAQVVAFTPAAMRDTLGFAPGTDSAHWWNTLTYLLVPGSAWLVGLVATVALTVAAQIERAWGTAECVRIGMVAILGGTVAHVMFADTGATFGGMAGLAMAFLVAHVMATGGGPILQVGGVTVTSFAIGVVGSVTLAALTVRDTAPQAAWSSLAGHLGAMLFAWAYLRITRSINLSRLREGVAAVPDEDEEEPPRAVPHRTRRPKGSTKGNEEAEPGGDDVVAQSNAAVAQEAARVQSERNEVRHAPRSDAEALNRMLDKIASDGIGSLSADERNLLDELSRRLRGQ